MAKWWFILCHISFIKSYELLALKCGSPALSWAKLMEGKLQEPRFPQGRRVAPSGVLPFSNHKEAGSLPDVRVSSPWQPAAGDPTEWRKCFTVRRSLSVTAVTDRLLKVRV